MTERTFQRKPGRIEGLLVGTYVRYGGVEYDQLCEWAAARGGSISRPQIGVDLSGPLGTISVHSEYWLLWDSGTGEFLCVDEDELSQMFDPVPTPDSPSPVVDPCAGLKVGDTLSEGQQGECSTYWRGYYCDRIQGHAGQHIAADDNAAISAVWPQDGGAS